MTSRGLQDFLRRWSRLKQEVVVTAEPGAKGSVSVTPSALPPLESMNFESDFGAFMRAKVDEGVKRAALKKLFNDPRFNIMDGLDVYVDDYSKEDPIPPAMLARLQQARIASFEPRAEGGFNPPDNAQATEATGQKQVIDDEPLRDAYYAADVTSDLER